MRNQIRIIGGFYRGRKISFPNLPELRPTPDRVRETLFNWLAPFILNARCLDLFSGSGVLGIEALSRGAASVLCLEKNTIAATSIEENAKNLQLNTLRVIQANALVWLDNVKLESLSPEPSFDIVFLDPPYQSEYLLPCFSLLEKNWLHSKSIIYFESSEPLKDKDIPKTWQISKEKKAGQVYYYLAQKN